MAIGCAGDRATQKSAGGRLLLRRSLGVGLAATVLSVIMLLWLGTTVTTRPGSAFDVSCTWMRTFTIVLLLSVLLLSGCGGGGAQAPLTGVVRQSVITVPATSYLYGYGLSAGPDGTKAPSVSVAGFQD